MSSNLTPDARVASEVKIAPVPRPERQPWWQMISQKLLKRKSREISRIVKEQTGDPHATLKAIASFSEEPKAKEELPPIYPKPDETQRLSHMKISPLAKPQKGESHQNEFQFLKHQKDTLEKHSDEIIPVEPGPFTVAMIKRSYRELVNGNFTESLISLATQTVPPNEFRAYFAVNNMQSLAVAAEVYDRNAHILQRLSSNEREKVLTELVDQEYKSKNMVVNYSNGSIYGGPSNVPLERRVLDYKENQATLSVLRSLTLAVNALSREPNIDLHDPIIRGSLEVIKQTASGFMTEAQLQTLLRVSQVIMKKRIAVMGVDCSSFGKATGSIDLGQPTNEAAHIALAQGAKFIDVSDMDEFHGPDALQEIVDIAKQKEVDIFIRPLKVVVPQHPEQLDPDSPALWPDLVSYYSNTLTYIQKKYGTSGNPSSGTQIVSARAFRQHEYPQGVRDEDFKFAAEMRRDNTLNKHFALSSHSDLRLSHRGRYIAWDGKELGMPSHKQTVELLRESVELQQRVAIRELVKRNGKIIEALHELQNQNKNEHLLPDIALLYEQQRERFFREAQEEKANFRRDFLGIRINGRISPNGLLPSAWRIWQNHQDWTPDQILEAIKLRPRKKAFLEQNPLLLKGALQELQRIQKTSTTSRFIDIPERPLPDIFDHSTEGILPLYSAIQHIANSLPELFSEPLIEEPVYDEKVVESLPSGEVNEANWAHLARAQRWLHDYIMNIDQEGFLPEELRNKLKTIISTI